MSTTEELRESALEKFRCRCGNEDLCDSEPVHIKKFWQAAYSQGYKDALKDAPMISGILQAFIELVDEYHGSDPDDPDCHICKLRTVATQVCIIEKFISETK